MLDCGILKRDVTNDVAWMLGFTVGDGYLYKAVSSGSMGIVYGIHPRDIDVLDHIKKITSFSGPIFHYPKLNRIELRLYSKELCNDAQKLGIGFRKSQNEKFLPCIKDGLTRFFILGLVEADGMIREKKSGGKWEVRITGTKELLNEIVKRLPAGIKTGKIRQDVRFTNNFNVSMFCKYAFAFLEWLYNPKPKYYMERKYNKYLEIKKYYEDMDRRKLEKRAA